MAGQESSWLPQLEPQQCRRRAEEFLGLGKADVDVPRAVAFALLAVAGELHEMRRQRGRR